MNLTNLTLANNDVLNDFTALDPSMSSRTYNVETFTFNNNIAAQSMGTAIFLVSGSISVDGNTILGSLNSFSGTTATTGNVRIVSNPMLTSLTGLEDLETVGGNLIIQNNDMLEDLNDLSSLSSVAMDLTVSGNDILDNCCAIACLPPAGGTTTIQNNLAGGNCESLADAQAACIPSGVMVSVEVADGELCSGEMAMVQLGNVANVPDAAYTFSYTLTLPDGTTTTTQTEDFAATDLTVTGGATTGTYSFSTVTITSDEPTDEMDESSRRSTPSAWCGLTTTVILAASRRISVRPLRSSYLTPFPPPLLSIPQPLTPVTRTLFYVRVECWISPRRLSAVRTGLILILGPSMPPPPATASPFRTMAPLPP